MHFVAGVWTSTKGGGGGGCKSPVFLWTSVISLYMDGP